MKEIIQALGFVFLIFLIIATLALFGFIVLRSIDEPTGLLNRIDRIITKLAK